MKVEALTLQDTLLTTAVPHNTPNERIPLDAELNINIMIIYPIELITAHDFYQILEIDLPEKSLSTPLSKLK